VARADNLPMPFTALGLVLAAALLHAVWNVVAKKAGGNHHFALITVLMTCVLWAPAALWFGLLEWARWGWLEWAVLGLSALVHVLYFTVLLTGYRKSDLTVVYPVARGSGPLLAAAGAVLLLGEHLTWLGVAGVLAVCCGVFLIAGGPALWRGSHDAAAHQRAMAGVRWGVLTGALIAGYTVIDGYAIKVLLIGPVVVDYVATCCVCPCCCHPRCVTCAACYWHGTANGAMPWWWPRSDHWRTSWCCMPCRWRRCRTWRLRARCRCCLPR